MANYTPNYNLKKPLTSELFTVNDANGNMDLVDTELNNLQDSKVDKVTGKSLVSDTAITDLTDGNETILHKHNATNIPFTPTGNLSSTNVQTALAELDNEKASKLFATNLVTNGDFSDGTTGWSGVGVSNAITFNQKMIFNGTANGSSGYVQDIPATTGDRLYFAFLTEYTSGDKPSIRFGNFGVTGSDLVISSWINGRNSLILNSYVNGVRVYFRQQDLQVYNNVSFDNISTINLTATFGAGKEPTKEQLDWLLAQKYTNSWFDGTKELCSITDLLTLVNTKANIAQEAWITPTLLNGWSVYNASFPVGYYKDQLGIVHLRGYITGTPTSVCLQLPIGYRPEYECAFSGATNSGSTFGRVFVKTDGTVTINSINTFIVLSEITFRAV